MEIAAVVVGLALTGMAVMAVRERDMWRVFFSKWLPWFMGLGMLCFANFNLLAYVGSVPQEREAIARLFLVGGGAFLGATFFALVLELLTRHRE